jgi:Na+-transporting NADH:ubiquinone oxidoreductase subunit F
MMEELEAIGKALPNFRLVCSLTRPTSECRWDGETRRVPELLEKYIDNAAEAEAYLCGNNDMIDSVVTALKAKGMPEEQIFYDKFM